MEDEAAVVELSVRRRLDISKSSDAELTSGDILSSIIKAAIDGGSMDNCSYLMLRFNSASPFNI